MRHLKVVNPTPQKLIFTLALWSCATLLWSIDLGRTGTALSTFLLYIGFCFIFLNTVRDKKSFFAVLSGFAVGAFITSSMLMAGYAAYETGSAAEMGRATLHEDVSPVILGRSIAFGFLAACCTFFWPGKLKKIITMGLLMLFFLAIATKTQSRTALAVALGVPVLSLILCSESKNRLKYFFFALLFGGIALFAVNQTLKSDLMTKRAKVRFQGQGLEESGRLRFWSLGFQAFLKRPIQGYGISNAPLALERLKGFSTHNNIVAISVELGLVGLVLFTAIFIVLYMQSRLISDVRLKWLGVAMLLFALVCGMTSTNYTKKDFWYALAVAMVAFNIQSPYKTGNAEPLKLDKDASRVA
jgi:O-antigen ligase